MHHDQVQPLNLPLFKQITKVIMKLPIKLHVHVHDRGGKPRVESVLHKDSYAQKDD
jgi:hypothetical protein